MIANPVCLNYANRNDVLLILIEKFDEHRCESIMKYITISHCRPSLSDVVEGLLSDASYKSRIRPGADSGAYY